MKVLSRAAAVALAAFLLVVVAHTVLSPLYGAHRYDSLPVLVVAAVVLVAVVPLTLVLARAAEPLEARPWMRRGTVGVAFAAFLYVQLQVGWAVRTPPGWDASVVAGIAERMALGLPDDPSHQFYVASYPNNGFIIAVLHVWDRLSIATGHLDLWSTGVVLNSLAMTGAVALTYLAARRMGGPVTAYVTLALSAVFIAVSPWIPVTYSDTLTMPFPAAVLYLFSLERTRTRTGARAALWAAMAALTMVGYALKPTAVFALAAAALVAVVVGATAWRRSWRTLAACTAALAVGLVAGSVLVGQLIETQGMPPAADATTQRLDVTHFLKMGAQQQPGYHNDFFGAYSEADVNETRETPLDDRARVNVGRYGERVAAMGPVGYARFLERKAAWTFGDGSFFAWSEGQMAADPTPFLVTDPRSQSLQRWFGLHGERYAATYSVWQGTWLVVLLLVAAAALARGRTQLAAAPTMARLSLLMLAAFLLLFEARSRYVFLYLPYVLVLAALSLALLAPVVSRRVRGLARGRRTTAG